MTTETFHNLQSEAHRANIKYPHQEWAEMTLLAMLRALISEVWELALAMLARDVHGPHGIIRESIQVANVAIRISEEIQRRFGKL